ncbi:MAG: prenylated flavin chaperone LpdD [Candidatus Jordarchaeum sp.]|uniref:prenylated flavin chaperone LpdD n=1 Tax=Candidatus Jordarchaeum sp. TaxID=2823881 RepID=UPI004049D033
MTKVFYAEEGEGKCQVWAFFFLLGDDLVVGIGGGERPHIGALAVAEPRPSRAKPDVISSTSSVITLLGHKDDIVAREAADSLASETNRVVTVTAGIHVENATKKEIETLLANSRRVIQKIIKRIKTLT